MQNYKLLSKKGEGTFSEVLKAQCLKTGKLVAIKCMKQHFDNIQQVQKLREIQALRKISNHPNIIQIQEVLYDEPTGRLALVFELMEQNLYESIKGRKTYLNPQKVKSYIWQLLKAIDHIHKKGIFHRDIKPENILLKGDQIKLADFGSCKGIYSPHPYTEYISTRWYRSTECLMTDGFYSYKMDLWGVGCVMFEILSLFPLFPGNNEIDQINKIHSILGTPDPSVLQRFQKLATHMEFDFPPCQGQGIENLIPNVPKDAIDLIYKLLIYDPEERITAEQALQHPYFKDIQEIQNPNDSINSQLSPSLYNRTLQEIDPMNMQSSKKHIMPPKNPLNSTKFNKTMKSNKDGSSENLFYPVLSIKKAQKKKSLKGQYRSQYGAWGLNQPHLNLNLSSDEENTRMFPQIHKKSSTKNSQNPFKQVVKNNKKYKEKEQQWSQTDGLGYIILGKKASYI